PNKTNPQTACVNTNVTPYTCLDLGCIPTAYAGRTVTLSIFDIGDGSASGGSSSLFVGVSPPLGGGTVTYPAALQPSLPPGNGVQSGPVAMGGSRPFNGLWLTAALTLPPTYQGDCTGSGLSSDGWWQLMYASGNGFRPDDKLAMSFSLVGSPVHLVPPLL